MKTMSLKLCLLLGLLSLLAACGQRSAGPEPTPATVTRFSAETNTILEGESTVLSWSGVSEGATLELEPDMGDVTGETSVNVSPTETTTYTLTASNEAGSNSYLQTVTVTPKEEPNQAPGADALSKSTPEDTALMIQLSGNDPEGEALSFAIVSEPEQGVLGELNVDTGEVLYTPNPDYSGEDSFSYTVSDGELTSEPAAVSITVGGTNDVPAANDQSLTTSEDTALDITLTGSDVDGDSLSFEILSAPENGSLSGDAPNLTYTPDAEFSGTDSFTYRVNDGALDSNIATVSITVEAVNDAPVALAIKRSTPEDTAVEISLGGSDAEDASLTFALGDAPGNGTLSDFDASAGTVTYTPNKDYTGSDSFSYTVSDGDLGSSPATVSITVGVVNDAPVADDQSVELDEDTSLAITLTASDTEGDALSFVVLDGPAEGSLSGDAPDLTYTPDENFNGSDSFTFRANDGSDDSEVATISITVNPVNDPPMVDDQSLTVNEDESLNITLTGSDVDGDSLTFSTTDPANGALSDFDADAGTVTYTPNENFNGEDSFTFTANDGSVDSASATITITVEAVNDAPVADDQSVELDEDTSPGLEITMSASDVDGDSLSYSVVTEPSHGSLAYNLSDSSKVQYTPNENYNGPDSFTFKTNDGSADSADATVSITVKAVNDAPSLDAELPDLGGDVDDSVNVTLSDYFSDIEDTSLSYSAESSDESFVKTSVTDSTLTLTLIAEGNADITVTATDNGSLDVSDSFTVTVIDICKESVIYVDADASEDGTGNSWGEAFKYLQDALACTETGKEIWVAAGTYYPDEGVSQTDDDRAATFTLTEGIKLYGGFAGTESDLTERDSATNVTALSGDIGTESDSSDNSYNVMIIDGTGTPVSGSTVVSGFTIEGGKADGSTYINQRGGGLYCNGEGSGSACSPSLDSLIFNDNSAVHGGGLFNQGRNGGTASPTLTDIAFSNNTASGGGGAIRNRAEGSGSTVSPSFVNVRFISNTANNGGAISNWATSSGVSTPTFTNVSFANNSASGSGGAVWNYSNPGPTFTNVSFGNNTASSKGGAIYHSSGTPQTLNNVILWGNTASSDNQVFSGSKTTISYSIVQGGVSSTSVTDGGNNLDSDPLFTDAADGDLTLSACSPAIDTGDSDAISLAEDLAGNDRFADDSGLSDIGNQGSEDAVVGMGAYEYQGTSSGCSSGTLYVKEGAGGARGLSWSDAFGSPQDALAAASAGQEIWVAAGTYIPSSSDRNISFELKNGVAVYGGFAGTESNLGERDVDTHVTILSGDIDGDDSQSPITDLSTVTGNTNNSNRVVKASSLDSSAVLDGFTITAGYTNGNGAGLYLDYVAPTMSNLTFTGNRAGSGGAVYIQDSSSVDTFTGATFSNVAFQANEAGNQGGAVYIRFTQGNRVYFKDASFIGNSATEGGAVYGYKSAHTLENALVLGNNADKGGAFYISNQSHILVNTVVSGNTATTDGGATYMGGGAIRAINVSFSSNTAGAKGGAVYAATGGINLTNSILHGNAATTSGSEVQLEGSASLSADYSLISGGLTGTDVVNTGTGSVNDNGNNLSGNPLFTDAANGDLSLSACSPAIDAGDSDAVSLTEDLAGNDRFADDSGLSDIGNQGTQDAVVDMGAYEYQGTSSGCPTTVYVDAAASGNADGSSWADAFTNVQDALHLVRTNSRKPEVWVAAGTYYPDEGGTVTDASGTTIASPDDDRDATFYLTEGVKLYGGFAGTETNRDDRDPASNVTVLSGDIGTASDNSDNSYHVLSIDGTTGTPVTSATVLSGFTVTAGNAGSGVGGGLYCNGMGSGNACNPSLDTLVFSHNTTSYRGGALYNDGGSGGEASPVLTNISFSNNAAAGAGGAVFNEGSSGTSSPTFTNVSFANNSADFGGAVFNHANGGTSSPTFTNTIFWGNTASSSGSQMRNYSATPSIAYSLLEGGLAGITNGGSGSVTDGGGNISSDPLFTDAANGDLSLRECSPAIDAGNNSAVSLGKDLGGNDRFANDSGTTDTGNGSAPLVDIGAYEFQGTSPCVAPTGLTLDNTSVLENEDPGTPVGTFSTTDANAGDTFSYSLVSGSGDTDNASFTIDGDVLKTAESFDFETKSSYSVRVRTTDSAGKTFEQSFSISVTDVDEGLAVSVIEIGFLQSCAVGSDDVTHCWGAGSDGQLGNGTTSNRSTPTAVDAPTGITFTTVSTNFYHTCAVDSGGDAYCWGRGGDGQLGNGSTTSQNAPVAVIMPGGVSFDDVVTGGFFSCALSTDGDAYCWGTNNSGTLGRSGGASSTPVAVTMPGSVTFSSIASGGYHTCGLGSDGTTYCWGLNGDGQLGNGSTSNASTPVAVTMPPGVTFTSVSGAYFHSCALGDDGNAYCWGRNSGGQLGDGTTSNRSTPTLVQKPGGVDFTGVWAGDAHSCALGDDGNAYCWGAGGSGRLGNGTTSNQLTPVAVNLPEGVTFTAMSLGDTHSCALGDDGKAYCWGSDGQGRLGNGSAGSQTTPVAVSEPQ